MISRERLPVRTHDVLGRGGARTTHVRVFCPSRLRTVPFETCATCARAEGLPVAPAATGAAVTCELSDARRMELAARGTGPDVGEAAARVRLGEAMGARLTSVRVGASVAEAARVLDETGQRAVVVLGDDDQVAGIATRRDLGRSVGTSPVTSVMSPFVHTLPEDACLAHAIALMACEDVRQIPIVDIDDEVVGMVSDRDIVRWLAMRLGYSTPAVAWEGEGAPVRHAPREVRDRVLADHVDLRRQLAATATAAHEVLAGARADVDRLAREVRMLSSAFRIHLGMEEAQLAPALVFAGLWSVARVDELHQEHARQRAALLALAQDLVGYVRIARELAEDALWLVASLTDDMAHEERELATMPTD